MIGVARKATDRISGLASSRRPLARALRSPKFLSDPYPFYERLRAISPLFYHRRWHTWVVTGYEECNTLLKDPRFGHKAQAGDAQLLDGEAVDAADLLS